MYIVCVCLLLLWSEGGAEEAPNHIRHDYIILIIRQPSARLCRAASEGWSAPIARRVRVAVPPELDCTPCPALAEELPGGFGLAGSLAGLAHCMGSAGIIM